MGILEADATPPRRPLAPRRAGSSRRPDGRDIVAGRCERARPGRGAVALRLAAFAMGTRFELVLEGEASARLRAAGEEALEEIELWERRLSRFRSDSLLKHVERHGLERAVPVDDEVFGLLERCSEVWRQSQGAFCVWRETQAAAATSRDPAVQLDREQRTMRLARPVQLDLGAVGKGFALDCARERLREAGVSAALLHGGTSSVATLGAPPGLAGWRVALESGPSAPVVELRDLALGVSAQHGGRGATAGLHVLDPRGGAPPPAERVAAVVHSSALLADAWSTALLVLGILPGTAHGGLAGWLGEGPAGARRWRPCGSPARAFPPVPNPSPAHP